MNINNTVIKIGANFISNLIPYSLIKKINGRDLIIPLYHVISDSRVEHIENIYHIKSIKDFEKDLDFFLKVYNPISFDDFYQSIINHKKFSKPSFLLTFDDGLVEFKEVIAPILIRKGIPAICFINSGFLDNKDLFYRHKASLLINEIRKSDEGLPEIKKWKAENFNSQSSLTQLILSVGYNNRNLLDELAYIIKYDWRSYLLNRNPYLSSLDIVSLQRKGFHFGAHSVNHPRYTLIDLDEQLKQTNSSVELISGNFKIKEKLFAFPFSDRGVDKVFFEKIYQQGIVDITFGTSGFDKSRLCFNHQQRISFDEDFSAKAILCIHTLYQVARSRKFIDR